MVPNHNFQNPVSNWMRNRLKIWFEPIWQLSNNYAMCIFFFLDREYKFLIPSEFFVYWFWMVPNHNFQNPVSNWMRNRLKIWFETIWQPSNNYAMCTFFFPFFLIADIKFWYHPNFCWFVLNGFVHFDVDVIF